MKKKKNQVLREIMKSKIISRENKKRRGGEGKVRQGTHGRLEKVNVNMKKR